MPKSVLIVEDDRDIRDPMRELLQDEGYDVTCVASGHEALASIKSAITPDVILCDLMMPLMSGVEFIETLKKINQTLAKSTVILSAATNAQTLADDLGVGFLRKPLDIEALLELLKQY